MYHDDGNVDVELLADLGYIAQRLRSQEKSWKIELKELQRQCLQGLEVPQLGENSQAKEICRTTRTPESINHLTHLEDTVIKIYYQQELIKDEDKINKKVLKKDTMNYLTQPNQSYSEGNSNSNTSDNSKMLKKGKYGRGSSSSASGPSRMVDKEATNSDDDSSLTDTEDEQSSSCTQLQYQQSILQQKISNDDLKSLIMELKRKVEYSEKMNWLCLSNRPKDPPLRKTSLPKHSEVKKRFLEMSSITLSDDVKSALRLPSFDSYDWDDCDILRLMETMFIELNLLTAFQINRTTLREWLYEVYKHYNDVPFHNFRHCFCVAQMMYAMSWQANLCNKIGELDVLILLVSCICHDLDHPGYNNIYQINARTELALRYNDISPLENHHCSLAFRLLENPKFNIFENMSSEMNREVREGIIRCILATDMARHNEILTQFIEVTPSFDYNNKSHKNLLCMVLIKVADISNESRPLNVAEPWLDRLLQEFFAQSAAEKMEGLPVTPFMDPDKVSKPGSQVRFIGLVLLPLFEALGELLTELIEFIIIPVRYALDYYKRLNDAAQKNRKSLAEIEGPIDVDSNDHISRSHSGISVKSRRSIPSQKSTSRNSVDETQLIAAELHDLLEGSESGDSETATEVDVAEKTSKFKVDTESRNKITQSQTRVHKSGREKRPSMVGEIYTTGGRMRGSFGNIHYGTNRNTFGSNRAISLDQYSSSNNRRLSDGIQTVTSDSSVYYNNHSHQQRQVITSVRQKSEDTLLSANNNSNNNNLGQGQGGNVSGVDDENNKIVCSNRNNLAKNSKMKSLNSYSSTTNNTNSKSLLTRLRNLTGKLSFSFDKDTRGLSSNSINSMMPNKISQIDLQTQQQQHQVVTVAPPSPTHTLKNNNANNCHNLNSMDFDLSKKISVDLINSNRGRAYSLDVPPSRFNFNSTTSSTDGSRKSLVCSIKNDESLAGSTNSNNTLSNQENNVFVNKKRPSEVDTIDGVDI